MKGGIYVLNFYSAVFIDQLKRGRKTATMIDDVEVKRAGELSRRDIEHDNPEFRRLEEEIRFLEQIYSRPVDADDLVTVIRFSQIVEPPHTHLGNGETPHHN
jgi:hypothetical protein